MTKDLFTGIAGVYDRMNHTLSLGLDRRWRRVAAACVENRPVRVLDLACGTGDFSLELSRRFPGVELLGVDVTPAMLEIAKGKCAGAKMDFTLADATDLSALPAGGFSLCACAFGFRNFPDRPKALGEVRRVLASGGELLVLEFFRPASALLGRLVSAWISLLAWFFARRSAAAYKYLRESVKAMDSVEAFIDHASRKGFRLLSRRFMFPCCTCLHFAVLQGDEGDGYE